MHADRNLLFGVLALQMDFISRDALIRGMNAWVLEKHKPLGVVLCGQGALSEETAALLDALLVKHLAQHQGDPRKSLAAIGVSSADREALSSVADADLQSSLGWVPPLPLNDLPQPTTPHAWSGGGPGLRFRPVSPHARGGRGEVYVAIDEELGREVALKEIQGRFADDPSSRARFLLEARVTGQLEHPGVVPVYGLGTYSDGRPYYAMRLIKGQSLHAAIQQFHAGTGRALTGERRLALRAMLRRFVDVCNAVAYAHSRGVIHRDLKPANVMLGAYGETLVVDWGLARLTARTEADRAAGEVTLQPASDTDVPVGATYGPVGTPAYMSPEQAAGHQALVGTASDVYSLGATLYEILVGRPPFSGGDPFDMIARAQRGEFPPPRRVNSLVPTALEAVCLQAMAMAPERRYPSARALAEDIERWLADEPVLAYRESWGDRLARWSRRHRAWMRAGAAALALTALSATTAAVLIEGHRRDAVEANNQLEVEKHNLATANSTTELALSREKETAARLKVESERRLAALRESRRQSALLAVDRALRLCQEGDVGQGLLMFARGLAHAVLAGDADLERVCRANLANWRQVIHPLRHMLRHSGQVQRVVFVSGGTAFVTAGLNGELQMWDTPSGLLKWKARHPGPVGPVVFSQDSQVIVSACNDRQVRWWSAATGRLVGEPVPHDGSIVALALSAGGKALLVAGGRTVRLWDLATRAPLRPVFRLGRPVTAATFSPDGRQVLITCEDRTARVWEVETGRPAGAPLVHKAPILQALFTPDGARVVTTAGTAPLLGEAPSTGVAQVWSPVSGQPLGPPMPHPRYISSAVISPDGHSLLTGCVDGKVRQWEIATARMVGGPISPGNSAVTGVIYSPDGRRFASLSSDNPQLRGLVHVYDSRTRQPVGAPLPYSLLARTIQFSPDGRLLVVGSGSPILGGGEVRAWDVTQGVAPQRTYSPGIPLSLVQFSPDAKRLVAASAPKGNPFLAKNEAHILDLAHWRRIDRPLPLTGMLMRARFCPDGATLITSTYFNTQRWDVVTGEPIGKPLAMRGLVDYFFRAGEKGLQAVGVFGDGTIQEVNLETGQRRGRPVKHPYFAPGAALSPDGKSILLGCYDRQVRQVDLTTGQLVGASLPTDGIPQTVKFSPDGQVGFTGSTMGQGALWDLRTRKTVGPALTHPGAKGGFWSASFSPDNRLVATATDHRNVYLWDTRTALPVGPPLPHTQLTSQAAFELDSAWLVTTAEDHVIRRWPVQPPLAGQVEAIALWCEVITGHELDAANVPRRLSLEEWQLRKKRLDSAPGRPVP